MQTKPNSTLHDHFRSTGATFEKCLRWQIPTVVAGEESEYLTIRRSLGISDLSDIGKLLVKGDGAIDLLNRVVTSNIDRLVENSICWTAILNDEGRVIADVQIYNDFGKYLITCNGILREKVLNILWQHHRMGIEIEDISEKLAVVSIEGPRASEIIPAIAGMDASGLSLLKFTHCDIQGTEVLLSRIGYTGEFGYLFFVHPEIASLLVERIQAIEPEASLCGRAVQTLLRMEVRAFDMEQNILKDESALEAGLHWMIDFRKPDFQGRKAVIEEKARGLKQRLVGSIIESDNRIERGVAVYDNFQQVGYLACSRRSPLLGKTIGFAYLNDAYAWVGIDLTVNTDKGSCRLQTVSAPFLVTESTKIAAR